jgi:hypothetical protein
VTDVPLPDNGSPGYSYFGRTKIPYYALAPALHPTEEWFRMMEGFKQSDPEWRWIEARRQAEQAQRDAARGELGRLAVAPCANPRQCLSWCNEAIDRLSEHVRLSGRRWDSLYSVEAARLADVVMDHARNLGADSATMASLRDVSRAVVRRPMDSQAPAGAARDMLARLAEWCRGQQGEGTGKSGDDAKAKGPPSKGDTGEAPWFTVTEAAKTAGVNTGVITRAVDAGQLKSNGKRGRGRRIDPADISRWLLARADKPEPAESDEQAKRLGDKHFRD